MTRATGTDGFVIEAEEPEMDRERVLDLLGAPFRGQFVAGAAEWLKNSFDHAIRTGEPDEPVILLRISTPGSRKERWSMECVDFLGTTYEEIDEHLKTWGSEIAASRGATDWAGFGGHGNGGKFHMRENFRTSEFITYRDGRLTVFGFNSSRQYGFDEKYRGAQVAPEKALSVAALDSEELPIPDSLREDLLSGDPARCRFTVVRGRGFQHVRRWHKRATFDNELQVHPQAKQVLDRARVIYSSDIELNDPLKPREIPSLEGYEDGRIWEVPGVIETDGDSFELSKDKVVGTLTLRVASEPFRRNDLSHAIDVKGRNGAIIATHRVTELSIRNRAGADFIYGVLDSAALDDLGLRQNDRSRLAPGDLTDALLTWTADRVDELSDELAKAENARRQQRDTAATLKLSDRLNRWKNKFLRAREVVVHVGDDPGTAGGDGSGGGGAGGPGPIHAGTGTSSGGTGTGGIGDGGTGEGVGGGGTGDREKRMPRFPVVRVSGFDPDPDTGEVFSLHPRQPVVYQRHNDVERNVWWINAQRPLPERILNEETEGAESARWRDYVFNRFVEVIQAYDHRANYDGTTDLSEFLWDLQGQIHDSAASELSDVLFGANGGAVGGAQLRDAEEEMEGESAEEPTSSGGN